MSEDAKTAEARAIALLEATHQFPVDYAISVIALNTDEVTAEVRTTVGQGRELSETPGQPIESRAGKYASHRFHVRCETPRDVLDLYERLRRTKGVVTVL